MIAPDDPRHGTTAGHYAGCSEACCREPRNRKERNGRKARELGRYASMPALGTQRRIQALFRLGWTQQHIVDAARLKHRARVGQILYSDRVFVGTAAAVDDAYRHLSMRLGPSRITAARAERAGYAPPLAWDDIDRDKQPQGVLRRVEPTVRRHDVDTLEDFDELAAEGYTRQQIADRLGMSKKALEKALARRQNGAA